jgi:MerR family transcriptional regulator, mercuric resistance operon regulatory protein
MHDSNEPIQIGALATRTGVNIETIRYYERIGILAPPARSPEGYRRYSREDAQRLKFIRRSRELGFSLGGVRALLQLARSKRADCQAVRGIAVKHLDEIKGKIKDLRRMERVLKDMLETCDGSARPVCPIVEALWDVKSGQS